MGFSRKSHERCFTVLLISCFYLDPSETLQISSSPAFMDEEMLDVRKTQRLIYVSRGHSSELFLGHLRDPQRFQEIFKIDPFSSISSGFLPKFYSILFSGLDAWHLIRNAAVVQPAVCNDHLGAATTHGNPPR